MNWDLVTNIILGASIISLAVWAVWGLYQLITRRSLKKVDHNLLMMLVPLCLMVVLYFLFDHVFIWNTRPDGSGEPSFPSTHVMVIATLFGLTALTLPRYIGKRQVWIGLDLVMIALTIVAAVGRVLANKHWVSDVVGGLIFAAILIAIYWLLIRKAKTRGRSDRKQKPETATKS